MPYLTGSGITQADGSILQDASGNDIAEQDWDFSALTATLNGQSEELLTRVGLPESTLFSYAAATNQAVAPIAGIVESIATILGIIETLQTILGANEGAEPPLYDLAALIWNQVGGGTTPPWPVIGQQVDENTTAILNAIADLSQGGGIGGGGDELARIPLWGDFYYAPAWPGTNPDATVVDGAPMVAGETRLEYLARVTTDLTWGTYHNGDGLVSAPLDAVEGGPRIVFRYTEDEWIARGGGARGGGGNPGMPGDEAILDAIAALRGGAATVTGVDDAVDTMAGNVEAARSDIAELRGGTATVQGVQDTLDALEIPTPPTAGEIAVAVWAELLDGVSAGARLITASGLDVDLTPVTDAIAALRGGTATVQEVLTAVNALSFPDVPTEGEVAAAVWAYLISGTAAGTLLNTAATRAFPNVPPVWPGGANVTYGDVVGFTESFSITTPMHGVVISVTTPPSKLGVYLLGGREYWYGMGRIAFADDQGRLEPWVYTGFEEAVYLPRTLKQASAVYVQVMGGAAGNCTPFTITQ